MGRARSIFAVLPGLVLVLVFTLVVGPTPATRASASDGPPNVVLFLVDDLGWQDTSVPLHTMRTPLNDRYRTPNVARLAARGMRFTQAYASAPVCTPTRTSIMTGQCPGRTHITFWTLHRDQDTSRAHDRLAPPAWRMNGIGPGDVTLPRLLRAAGYRTIHVGKAHFGAHGTGGADPRRLGFDENVAGHASGAPASYLATHGFARAGRRGAPDAGPSVWDVPGLEPYHGQERFLTEVLAIEAVHAIGRAIDDGVPFFLNMAPYAVHTPIMANTRYLEAYPDLPPVEAAYATMVESADAALGTILDALETRGVAERTLVIFSSDNGGLSAHARGGEPHTHNAPLRSGKGSAHEGGTRVPQVIAWPGVTTPGSVCRVPVVSHDLFPTILAAAGVAIPPDHAERTDGRDLGPLLRGAAGFDTTRVLGWNQPHQWGARGPGIEPFTSLRDGRWKLIYYHDGGRFALYDLEADPGETTDLAATDPPRVATLAGSLDRWIRVVGAQLSIDRATGRPIEGPATALARPTPSEAGGSP